ncbi:SWIM zinc finger family protein [Desulfobacter curvatus]|uniref:SWIM zinc finger family protein n=1 Tax=Desulfobacter curvatus TaxID=2290 RepID=UPI00037BB274|nr:SWIM zinc finger family protein [Desulfobacter curvatus]
MYYGYPKYVSVAEKRAKAEKKLAALKKKNPGIQPVVIEGQALAKTWWGKAWNKNLERYADYANRIGRGRSYVRHGAVLDLQIQPGKVSGLVMGSTSTPYRVTVTIKPIPPKQWQHIKNECKGKMDSIKQLMAGKFPKALGDLFTQKGKGLFPSPKEIELDCSCPDWAVMCKHVAAVLYGIGARLDQDPGLFFVLRKAKVNDLVAETVKETKKDLLIRSGKKSSRIIDQESQNLSDMFGIDLDMVDQDGSPPLPPAKTKPAGKASAKPGKSRVGKVKSGRPKAAKAKNKSSRPADTARKTASAKIKTAADIETLFKRRTKSHTTAAEVIEKSDMDPQKVRNILSGLLRKGKLERVSRGVYKWVRPEEIIGKRKES